MFQGWSNKVGKCVLILTVLAGLAWARSTSMHDSFSVSVGNSSTTLESVNGTVACSIFVYELGSLFSIHQCQIHWDSWALAESEFWRRPARTIQQLLGFRSYQIVSPLPHVAAYSRTIEIPHWSIVLTLTLISVWLLSSKPKKAQTVRPVKARAA